MWMTTRWLPRRGTRYVVIDWNGPPKNQAWHPLPPGLRSLILAWVFLQRNARARIKLCRPMGELGHTVWGAWLRFIATNTMFSINTVHTLFYIILPAELADPESSWPALVAGRPRFIQVPGWASPGKWSHCIFQAKQCLRQRCHQDCRAWKMQWLHASQEPPKSLPCGWAGIICSWCHGHHLHKLQMMPATRLWGGRMKRMKKAKTLTVWNEASIC
jgi:hypothetical protein